MSAIVRHLTGGLEVPQTLRTRLRVVRHLTGGLEDQVQRATGQLHVRHLTGGLEEAVFGLDHHGRVRHLTGGLEDEERPTEVNRPGFRRGGSGSSPAHTSDHHHKGSRGHHAMGKLSQNRLWRFIYKDQ